MRWFEPCDEDPGIDGYWQRSAMASFMFMFNGLCSYRLSEPHWFFKDEFVEDIMKIELKWPDMDMHCLDNEFSIV